MQLDLNFSGEQLRDIGIKMAEDNANDKVMGWSEKAFELLKKYLTVNKEKFMGEYFRVWAETTGGLESPPHARAYGSVILKASKMGLIVHCGYSQVSNYKAHKANAAVWRAAK